MIKLYVGEKGSGKTLHMVKDAQWFFKQGYDIVANFPVWGYSPKMSLKRGSIIRKLFSNPLEPTICRYMYPEHLEQAITESYINKRPTLFLLDEAPVIYNSRNWKNFDLDLVFALNQSRKTKVHFFMTAQRFKAVDKQLRDASQYVYKCEKMLFKPIRIFSALCVKPEYFDEEQDSALLKYYIIKRKYFHESQLAKYFQFYATDQVIGQERIIKKYPNLFPDPKLITIDEILVSSKLHKEEFIPV
jgi:hypothetical protein